ncbi:glycine-rich cell wall structural protein-like [Eucalyptus grandis]|uniref:glycine-rich cell wall structural protein-like n=1 Tax=Eucalyptus grandis TaxID=71139 RepID=UPI00192F0344|nr:glycine-rich cell wall structural protein-like [Eucalyptus grandis]
MHEQAKVAVKQASDTSAGGARGFGAAVGRRARGGGVGCHPGGQHGEKSGGGSEGARAAGAIVGRARASCRSQVTGEGSGSGGAVWIAASRLVFGSEGVSRGVDDRRTAESLPVRRVGGAGGASDAGRRDVGLRGGHG